MMRTVRLYMASFYVGLTIKESVVALTLILWGDIILAQQTVPTTATFIVRDDIGQVVTNAEIEGGFRDVTNAGSRDRFKKVTDANGILVVKGNAMIGVGGRIRAAGYYETLANVPLREAQRLGLKRWDVEVPVLLKRIRNPIVLPARELANEYTGLWERASKYNLGNTASYDFLKGEYLPLFGTGVVADVVFKWTMTIYVTNQIGRAIDFDTLWEIRTPHAMDGIIKGKPDGSEGYGDGSCFISDYEAPVAGYTNFISFYRNVRGNKAESNDDRHYLYYFRIRTQTNELGQVTNAFYGKTYGQINNRFTYFLNPTPNDRNVEEKRKWY